MIDLSKIESAALVAADHEFVVDNDCIYKKDDEDLQHPVAHYMTSSYMHDQDFGFVNALASMHARLSPGVVRTLIGLARKGVTQSATADAALLSNDVELNSDEIHAEFSKLGIESDGRHFQVVMNILSQYRQRGYEQWVSTCVHAIMARRLGLDSVDLNARFTDIPMPLDAFGEILKDIAGRFDVKTIKLRDMKLERGSDLVRMILRQQLGGVAL